MLYDFLYELPSPAEFQENQDADVGLSLSLFARPVLPCKPALLYFALLCSALLAGPFGESLIVFVTEGAALSESLSYTLFSYFTPFYSLFRQLLGQASSKWPDI